MGYLKGKSSLAIYERWGNAKFRYRNREFWCRGYYVDTAGKNTQKITEYIRNQLKEDAEQSQLTMDLDPFTVSQVIFALSDRHAPLRRSLALLGLHPLKKNHRLSRWGSFLLISLQGIPSLVGAECFRVATTALRTFIMIRPQALKLSWNSQFSVNYLWLFSFSCTKTNPSLLLRGGVRLSG